MRARKRFGQHFLEAEWVSRVVEAIRPKAEDEFLEIGPGTGALTLALAPLVRRLTAVEIDRDLAPALARKAPANVSVIQADFLEVPPSHLLEPGRALRAAGNLPYNVATPILFRLLDLADQGRQVVDATVMLQREVAERLAATPGTKDWGVLSACQQLRADVQLVLSLPPGAFRPAPKVHSSVVRLAFHPPSPAVRDPGVFDALVRAIFTQRRKMLRSALAGYAARQQMTAAAAIERAGLDGTRRPEALSVAELARLADVFVRA